MSYEKFIKSQLYTKKSLNLIRLGFDYNKDPKPQYQSIQLMLVSKYITNNETMEMIMEKFKIPSSKTIHTLFNLFDISTRSFSGAGILAFDAGRANARGGGFRSNQQWHLTWDGKQVFLRSSHELVLAKQLDEAKIKYEVESLRVKYFDPKRQIFRTAIPDFYLPESNTVIEVKSNYWLDKPSMNSKVLAYEARGFKFKLFLDLRMQDNCL